MAKIKPRIKAIADLIDTYNNEAIHAVFGASQVGKSTLWLQCMYDISDQLDKPVLYYDCEGGGSEFIDLWHDVFIKKYPKARIDVRMKRDYKAILKDHGKIVKVKYSGGKAVSDDAKKNTSGKTSLLLVDEIDPSPISELIHKEGYGAVFYDSVTMPMKAFGSEQQNFPARNTAQTLWFSEMLNLIDEHGVYVISASHSSKNPAEPYAKEEMAGGNAVQYYCKVQVYMRKFEARGATNYRQIVLARYFNKAPNEHKTLLKLTDDGYIDVTEKDLDADKAKAKK